MLSQVILGFVALAVIIIAFGIVELITATPGNTPATILVSQGRASGTLLAHKSFNVTLKGLGWKSYYVFSLAWIQNVNSHSQFSSTSPKYQINSTWSVDNVVPNSAIVTTTFFPYANTWTFTITANIALSYSAEWELRLSTNYD